MLDRADRAVGARAFRRKRACVLLKDVFDYSLEEIAGLVDFDDRRRQSRLEPRPGKLAMLIDVQRARAEGDQGRNWRFFDSMSTDLTGAIGKAWASSRAPMRA